MAGAIPPVLLELKAKYSEVTEGLGEVRSEYSKTASETSNSTSKMSTAFKGAAGAGKVLTVGLLGAGTAIAGFSIEAATAGQVAETKLNNAIKNTGASAAKLKPQIEDTDAKMRSYGFTNENANQALTNLTTALGSPKKAMDELGVAANLARTKNISLSDAAMLVAKTSEGQTRGLKSLGIDLPVAAASAAKLAAAQQTLATDQGKANAILAASPDAANASSKAHKSYEAALTAVSGAQSKVTAMSSAGGQMLDALSKRVNGAATAYGGTFQGQLTAARSGLEDMGETIGNALLPAIQGAIKVGTQWADYLAKNKPLLIAIAAIVGGVVLIAIGAYIASMIAAAAATIAAMWPILLIIAGVALLVAAILWLVANWNQVVSFLKTVWQGFLNFMITVGTAIITWWTGLWNGIVTFATNVFRGFQIIINDIFTTVWNTLVSIGNGIEGFWNGLWTGIANFVISTWTGFVGFISGGFATVSGWFSSFAQTVSGIWNGIWSGVGDVVKAGFSGVVSFVKGIFNSIIGVINGVIDGINSATSIGAAVGIHIGKIGHLPSLDIGGTIPGRPGEGIPILAHGGEEMLSRDMLAGRQPIRPEVIAAVAANAARYATQQTAGYGANAAPGNRSVTVNATTNASPQVIAKTASRELKRLG